MCLGVFLLGFILYGTLHFLDLGGYFLSHVREVFEYNIFRYFKFFSNIFSGTFSFSFSSGTPIIQMLVHLMSQRSPRLSSIIFILFSLFFSSAIISTTLSSSSFICCSASVILLLILSSVFFISVIVLFITVCSLVLVGVC